MKTLEYNTKDKSKFGDGPWQHEPDKVQFVDQDTGLPCLIVRNRMGALCGYVGVDCLHPFFEKAYSQRIKLQEDKYEREVHPNLSPMEHVIEGFSGNSDSMSLSSYLLCHGGLTFASKCTDMSLEAYQRWCEHIEQLKPQAAIYPKGDAAERLATQGHLVESYEAWKEYMQANSICHLVEEGENDDIWWFGFDCGHCRDLSPGMASIISFDTDTTYRDIDYVKSEIKELARQLKELDTRKFEFVPDGIEEG